MYQKADHALEELCNDVPFERRLQLVFMHLEVVMGEHYIRNAPPVVQEAMERAARCKNSDDLAARAFAARRAITTILEAWGQQEGLRIAQQASTS